ncbi:MAG: RNA polymerase sigma factor [Candidatus Eiseniibacteriota bacterium]
MSPDPGRTRGSGESDRPPGSAPSEGSEPDDATLVRRCLKEDGAAFRILVGRYQADVYSTALRLLGRPEDAEDMTQETFLRAFRALRRYDPTRPFGAWLHTIASRLCIDHHRRNRAKMISLTQPEEGSAGEERTIELEDPGDLPEETAERTELARRLEALVLELPPDSRAAILLRHQQDLPYEEIARVLGVPLGTVKARIHRARIMLREKLLAQGDIPWEGETGEESEESESNEP